MTTVVQSRSQDPTGACQLGSGGRPANLVLVAWGGLGGVGGGVFTALVATLAGY